MTEQNYDITDTMNEALTNYYLGDCISALINTIANNNDSCVDRFPRLKNPMFQIFCQPEILEKARIIIYESTDIELLQLAFLDSITVGMMVSIVDNPKHTTTGESFLKAPPPKVMQNYNRDDLWRRFQADYIKWLESIPEEYKHLG